MSTAMLHHFTNRRRLAVLLAVLGIVALVVVGRWLNANKSAASRYRAFLDAAEAELRQGRVH